MSWAKIGARLVPTEIAAEFPLIELAAAHQFSQAGHLRGKILINIADM